jgi:hypothetical protein
MIPQKTMKNQENQRNCVSVGAGAGHGNRFITSYKKLNKLN